jgi:drug/metabolite transporter (DMT)-like permease
LNAPHFGQPGRLLSGILLTVLATALFSGMDSTGKVLVTAGVPALMALWGRYFFQALATALVVVPLRGRKALSTRHLPFQVLRGLLLMSGTALLFICLRYLPIGEFTAIMMIAPMLMTLMSAVLFKEQVSPLRWILVAGGFVGTLVIMRPGGHQFHWAMLLALVQVILNSSFQLLTARMARTEDPLTMHLYTGLVGATVVTLMLPAVWVPPASATAWAQLVGLGLLGGSGHFLLILGYRRAPTRLLTPYLYMQIPFAMLAGWWLFDHVPDGWAVAGMALIAASGVGAAWLTVHESRSAERALLASKG